MSGARFVQLLGQGTTHPAPQAHKPFIRATAGVAFSCSCDRPASTACSCCVLACRPYDGDVKGSSQVFMALFEAMLSHDRIAICT